ncbi:hypothetical protein ACFY2R_25950 [Micromonospora olivasterospora]|uniref:Uncharacterized protein n=1 Tax=Micromonospora olivasterospora TaxID=1880 RepID=A0A562I5A2_MICOL|nr:hypothetical protein [Micromonospora olivasterospora]TWH66187.1 hypothetical protein JD77_01138 [Micromonospora olivasterospora]
MSHDQSDQDRVESRAHLLPEEAAVGSEDPQAQADAILTESDIREDVNLAPDTVLERRTSEEAATVVPERRTSEGAAIPDEPPD